MSDEIPSSLDDQLFEAARKGDVEVMRSILDEHPDKLEILTEPYEQTMLHLAASEARLDAVNFLLERGLDVNARDGGDNTSAMHWAAAKGDIDVVRRLADAGGDVVGHGDDHALEVIGWATGWDGCDDETHRRVAEFLISRGARHNIYSAISLRLPEEIRRIVAEDPEVLKRGQSHNDNFQLPLHFAARKNLPDVVALLIQLGADPMGHDAGGITPLHAAIASGHPDVVRQLLSAGADPSVRDGTHDSDAIGWAEYFERQDLVELLRRHSLDD